LTKIFKNIFNIFGALKIQKTIQLVEASLGFRSAQSAVLTNNPQTLFYYAKIKLRHLITLTGADMSYEENNNLEQENQSAKTVNGLVITFKTCFERDVDIRDTNIEASLTIQGEDLSSLLISKINATI